MSPVAWKRGYKRTDLAIYLAFAVYAILGCIAGASGWILLPDFSKGDEIPSLAALLVAVGLMFFVVLRLFVLKLTPWVISGYRDSVEQPKSTDLARAPVEIRSDAPLKNAKPIEPTTESTCAPRDCSTIEHDNVVPPDRTSGAHRLFIIATAVSILVTVALVCVASTLSRDSIHARLGFLAGSSVWVILASLTVGRLFRKRAPMVGRFSFAALFLILGVAISANMIREAHRARAATTAMANSLQELVSGNAITPVKSPGHDNDPAARLASYTAAYTKLIQDDQISYSQQVTDLVGPDPVSAATLSDVAKMRSRLPGLARAAQLADSLLVRFDQRQADYIAGLSAAVQDEQLVGVTIGGFREGAKKTRSCAEAITTANRSYYEDLYGIYRLLIANVGQYQFSGEQIVFADTSALSKFNSFVDDINLQMRISQEQYSLWTRMAQEQINVMRELPK